LAAILEERIIIDVNPAHFFQRRPLWGLGEAFGNR
jgi:hypothetical protein